MKWAIVKANDDGTLVMHSVFPNRAAALRVAKKLAERDALYWVIWIHSVVGARVNDPEPENG